MYEVFEKLIQKYEVTPYKVAKEAGVTQTALSNWKSGRSTPSAKTLQKIADYFGVTVDYLMTGKGESEKKESEIAGREKRFMEYARQLMDMGITPEDLESLIDIAQKMGRKE
ncbi:helix-turn-helix domain-containing protein [Lacrimispora sp.]|uniref:helix-turn-helix domain-containing protein n=1 Tax=Lacrimispora sp. TaxID=2719234 RepID=UPI00285F5447|nr:helix-turn-helix domain-containing protein [Lacrimispora sp.]MDR7815140.1 helix-turn-helix domain-containing protein [Lacrimispora sp.]